MGSCSGKFIEFYMRDTWFEPHHGLRLTQGLSLTYSLCPGRRRHSTWNIPRHLPPTPFQCLPFNNSLIVLKFDATRRVREVKIHHVQADREIFYAHYGNTAVDLDSLPVSRARLTVVEPVLFE